MDVICNLSNLAHLNGLDSVVQRKRKIQEIATPLSRLAMTRKWDSTGAMSMPPVIINIRAGQSSTCSRKYGTIGG